MQMSCATTRLLALAIALLALAGCGQADRSKGQGAPAAGQPARLPNVNEIVALMRIQLETEAERRPQNVAIVQLSFAPDIPSSQLVALLDKYPDIQPTDVFSRDPGLSIGSLTEGQSLSDYFDEVVASSQRIITHLREALLDACAGRVFSSAVCDKDRIARLEAQQAQLKSDGQISVYGLGVRAPHASLLRLWNEERTVFAIQIEPSGRVEGPPILPGMDVERWY